MCVSEWHAMLRDFGASCGVGAVGLSLAHAQSDDLAIMEEYHVIMIYLAIISSKNPSR